MSQTTVGRIDPRQAFELMQRCPQAILIDVRSRMEYDYVGHPLGAVHIPWKEFPDWGVNPRFVEEVQALLRERGAPPARTPVLLLCRSGARSLAAGEALAGQGFGEVYNVEEGFEGDRDAHHHRSTVNGWRYRGLPWEQG